MIGNATTSWNAERWRHVNRMNCKGSATRGNATISWHVERRLHVKRMGGKGSSTRSNVTTSRGKQKANGRWEVEVAHQEAGARQKDEQQRQRDIQPEERTKRMSGGGDTTTSQARGTGGHGVTRGNGAMRGGDAGRWEAAASVEIMQQPAGQEVCEAMVWQEAMAG